MGKWTLFILSILGLLTTAYAHAEIWNSQGELSGFETLSESLKTQSVIVLGENHGLKTHQNQHIQILNELRRQGREVHVGLEFFPFINQNEVDAYRRGELSEVDFLKAIGWGAPSYDFYRDQAVFPDYGLGERTWALNSPRSVTGQVSKVGLDQLSDDLKKLLPPQFHVGRDSYRKRFIATMIDHVKDPQKLQNYFEAQSVWDDTMAWRIQTFQNEHPHAVLVVIVGEFHVQYGGGLPDRLKARGVKNVLTISQVNSDGLNSQDLDKQVQPDAEYGPRADWIWTAPAVD